MNILKERNHSPVTNNKRPIVIAGCSFIYGQSIKEEETLPYRISNVLQVPVRNVGIPAKALNTHLYLIEQGIFDNLIKDVSPLPPQIFLYNYGDFHIMRLVMPMLVENESIFYKIKKDKLVLKKPPFIIMRSSILSLINQHFFEYASTHSKLYENYLLKLLKLHFIQTKKLLEQKYPDIKFVILVYFESPMFEKISKELEENGFYIIRMKQDLNIDVNKKEYNLPCYHPSPLFWEVATPIIAEKLKTLMIDDDLNEKSK